MELYRLDSMQNSLFQAVKLWQRPHHPIFLSGEFRPSGRGRACALSWVKEESGAPYSHFRVNAPCADVPSSEENDIACRTDNRDAAVCTHTKQTGRTLEVPPVAPWYGRDPLSPHRCHRRIRSASTTALD